MSLKLFNSFLLVLFLLVSMLITTSVFACDNKGCESAYLAETQQHVANHLRRAEAIKAERHAYSKNRHRRAYALYVHIHFMMFGSIPS
jgi:hypothetical protein